MGSGSNGDLNGDQQSAEALLARLGDRPHNFTQPSCPWDLLPKQFEHPDVEAAFQASYVCAIGCSLT